MKKFLIIALSAVFVLGLAASAFAIHAEIPSETQAVVAKGETQVTLGGSIRVRGEYRDTMDYNNANEAKDKASYDQRVRLSFAAKVSDDVSGLIMLESTNASYSPAADAYTWGSNSGASGVYRVGNAKPTDVQIVQAWILYKNDLVNLKIGHMPLALGNKIFFDHRKFGDDAIVLYKDIDNTHLAAIAIKLREGLTAVSDDADAYVALFAHKGDGFNVSGDVTWVNDNGFPTLGTQTDLYNFGLRGDTTVASIKLKADVEMQTGDSNGGIALGCSTAKCDFAGYAIVLGASADLDSVTLGLEFGYGSGDDSTDSDFDSFITSLIGGVPYITYVHGTRSTNTAGAGNGITNLTYLKGSVSGTLADNVTAKAALIWLQASEDYVTGKDDIGVELDAKVTYKLAKNLVYWVEGGYLFVDEAYAVATGAAVGSEGDAYGIRHGIELSF